MVWSAIQKYSTMAIHFISGIILARLLTPYDYGCIGMLSIFMVLAETFIDGGFASALIQKSKPTQVDYSTIFFWNLGMAILMYAILFVFSPTIARFYNIPELSAVLRVQGIVLFLYAFNIVQRNRLRKALNFKILSIVSVVTAIISLIITVFAAFKGLGVWALVINNLVNATVPGIFFWFYVKWRPSFVFSWSSFKALFGFGAYMFLTHLVNNFSGQIQGLLIGKIYSPTTMGYYSKAYSTERLASHSISQVMTQVTYPLYAEVQDNKLMMIQILKRITSTVAYLTFPLLFLLLLAAKPIFVLLYSDKWLQSVPYFQVLCFVGLAVCLQAVNLQAIPAIGKSRVMFTWTLIKRGVGLSAILSGLFFFGMKGLLAGVAFNSWFSLFVNMALVSKHVGYKMRSQILDLIPILAVSALSAVVCYLCVPFLNLPMYADGAVKVLALSLLYMGWSWIFKPEAYRYTKTTVLQFIGMIRGNKVQTQRNV